MPLVLGGREGGSPVIRLAGSVIMYDNDVIWLLSLMPHLDPGAPGDCQVRPGPPPRAMTDAPVPYLSLMVASPQTTLAKSNFYLKRPENGLMWKII